MLWILDVSPTDLWNGWRGFAALSPGWQAVIVAGIALLIIVAAMFFGFRKFYRGKLEAKNTELGAQRDAHQRVLAEKDATIERQCAEISVWEQRIRQRDDQLTVATKSATVIPVEDDQGSHVAPSSTIGTPQQLNQHASRIARLWDQAIEHRGQFDDACKQALRDWERRLSALSPWSPTARFAELFPHTTTPEEDMNASLRQLDGVSSDFRGSLALLTQALNFETPRL